MWYWRRMEKIKWSEKVTNEVLERIGEIRMLLNNILRRKVNCIGDILRRWIGHIQEESTFFMMSLKDS